MAEFIEYEPSEATDDYLRGMIASLGIIKGKKRNIEARNQEILGKAAEIAPKMAIAINATPEAFQARRYYTKDVKRQWFNAYPNVDERFHANGYWDINAQAAFFLCAYSSSPAMVANMVGTGSKYPSTLWDADGDPLVGDRSYRLHLPPNPPARLFWSVTIYNPMNGTMIDNGQPFPSINSMSPIAANSDGSYDIYFGPELTEGRPASNWIKTNSGQGYLVSLRLYGPTEAFFDLSWIPDDIVKLQ